MWKRGRVKVREGLRRGEKEYWKRGKVKGRKRERFKMVGKKVKGEGKDKKGGRGKHD